MEYSEGDIVAYSRSGQFLIGEPVELGVVKRLDAEGGNAWVAYNLGDTVACTPMENIRFFSNQYAMAGLLERTEQLGWEYSDLMDSCEDWSRS